MSRIRRDCPAVEIRNETLNRFMVACCDGLGLYCYTGPKFNGKEVAR
jgi:hypothetical protein